MPAASEVFEEPRAGRVALGGYVVFPEAPERRCVCLRVARRGDAKRNGRVVSPLSRIKMYFKRFSIRSG
jgi:hypothetical protein